MIKKHNYSEVKQNYVKCSLCYVIGSSYPDQVPDIYGPGRIRAILVIPDSDQYHHVKI